MIFPSIKSIHILCKYNAHFFGNIQLPKSLLVLQVLTTSGSRRAGEFRLQGRGEAWMTKIA